MDERDPRKTEYDAPGEYRRETMKTRMPGNVPVDVMRRVRAAEFNSLMLDPDVQSAMTPGYTTNVAKIMMLDKDARIEALGELTNPEEIKGAMLAERDPDIIRYLAECYAEAILSTAAPSR